jgi:hypothetical protein
MALLAPMKIYVEELTLKRKRGKGRRKRPLIP